MKSLYGLLHVPASVSGRAILSGIAIVMSFGAFGQPAAVAVAVAVNPTADLAKARNCMSCHNVDRHVVGPAFKDVAAKYSGQKDAVEKLSQKVISGGSGSWGVVAMPANKQVSDAEAKQLVGWILGLK